MQLYPQKIPTKPYSIIKATRNSKTADAEKTDNSDNLAYLPTPLSLQKWGSKKRKKLLGEVEQKTAASFLFTKNTQMKSKSEKINIFTSCHHRSTIHLPRFDIHTGLKILDKKKQLRRIESKDRRCSLLWSASSWRDDCEMFTNLLQMPVLKFIIRPLLRLKEKQNILVRL